MEGWIKIHRSIEDWEWEDEPLMYYFWVRLLVRVNYEDKEWKGIQIPRGSMITSMASLAHDMHLSVKQVRTYTERLIKRKQIVVETTNKWTKITICKYEDYQVSTETKWQTKGKPEGKQNVNQRATTKEIKNKEDKNINLSSSLSSSSFTESDAKDSAISEEEKEKILKNFFFRNLVAPEKEVEKFIAFNSEEGREWERMSEDRKEQSLRLWQQIPHREPRFRNGFLEMWSEFYGKLSGAPVEIRLEALSDRIDFKCGAQYFILQCSAALKDYIEENLDELKPVIWPYVTKNRCKALTYKIE